MGGPDPGGRCVKGGLRPACPAALMCHRVLWGCSPCTELRSSPRRGSPVVPMPPWRAPSAASRDLRLETLHYLFPVAMEKPPARPQLWSHRGAREPFQLLFPFVFYLCKGGGSHSRLCYANPGRRAWRTPSLAGSLRRPRVLWKGPVSPNITSHEFLVTFGSDVTHPKGEFRFPSPGPPLGVTTADSLRGCVSAELSARIGSVGDACVPRGEFSGRPSSLPERACASQPCTTGHRATGAGAPSAWKIGAIGRRRGSGQLAGDPVSLWRGSRSLFLANGL